MTYNTPHLLGNMVEAVWWHVPAWLPLAPGHLCFLMMWQKTEAASWILCIGSGFVGRMAPDSTGRWSKTYCKSHPAVFKGSVEYCAMAASVTRSQPSQAAFHLLKTKRPPTSSNERRWQSISKSKSQSLLVSMGPRLQSGIACKEFSRKY